jgi:phage shock protein A
MKLRNNNLYDEMLLMRDQLLTRIEILEDEVDHLTEENMYYSKQLYTLESDINTLFSRISQIRKYVSRLEYQESSKEVNKES